MSTKIPRPKTAFEVLGLILYQYNSIADIKSTINLLFIKWCFPLVFPATLPSAFLKIFHHKRKCCVNHHRHRQTLWGWLDVNYERVWHHLWLLPPPSLLLVPLPMKLGKVVLDGAGKLPPPCGYKWYCVGGRWVACVVAQFQDLCGHWIIP